MKKIIISIIVICWLFTTSILSVNAYDVPQDQGQDEISGDAIPRADIYVDDDNIEGPWDGTYSHPYRYIGDAINASEEGGVIFVFRGIYNEEIFLGNSIKLIAQERATTIIYGAANVGEGAILDGFTITTGRDGYGVSVGSDGTVVNNCIKDIQAFDGIGSAVGIQHWYYNVNITGNTITNIKSGPYGIAAGIRPEVEGAGHFVFVGCISDSIIADNTIKDVSGYWASLGIWINFDRNITIINNTAENIWGGDSIGIFCTKDKWDYGLGYNLKVADNFIKKVGKGIHCDNCIVGDILRNVIQFTVYGVFLEDSTYFKIIDNTFKWNLKHHATFVFTHHLIDDDESFVPGELPESYEQIRLKKDLSNLWLRNYWGRPRVLPKTILGKLRVYRNWDEDPLGEVDLNNYDLLPRVIDPNGGQQDEQQQDIDLQDYEVSDEWVNTVEQFVSYILQG